MRVSARFQLVLARPAGRHYRGAWSVEEAGSGGLQFVLAVAIRAAVVKAVEVDALHAHGDMALFVLAAAGEGGWGVGDELHAVADGEGKSGC